MLLLKTKARHFRPDVVRQTQDARIWTVHDTADASINASVLVDAPVLAKRKPIFVLMLLGALLLTLLTVMLLLSLFQLPLRIPRFVRIRCVPLYMDAGKHLAPPPHIIRMLPSLCYAAPQTLRFMVQPMGKQLSPPRPQMRRHTLNRTYRTLLRVMVLIVLF